MHTNEPEIYNYLDALPLPIALALQERAIYRRFLSAQAQMERLAVECWAQTGTLNSPAVLAQEAVVTALGREVMAEIRRLEGEAEWISRYAAAIHFRSLPARRQPLH